MTDQLDQLKFALADRYIVDRPIGRGGMATVYLAVEIQLRRPVAIKVLDQSLGWGDQSAAVPSRGGYPLATRPPAHRADLRSG